MEIALGPVLFEWKRTDIQRFYESVCDMDVDRVYLGEVVCYKKQGLTIEDIAGIGGMLERAGKKVFVSSLAVVSNEDELSLVRKTAALGFAVEANDMSIMNMVDPKEREVSAGPHITTYNVPSIEFLMQTGIRHVTFPVELPRESIKFNIENTGIEAEVFVHGKVPLAFSWRCYTSRAFGLSKEECRHDCARFPEGMEIKTLDKEPLFTINGTSILSARVYTLVEFTEDLEETGVKTLRISPQPEGTEKVVDVFRRRLSGELGPEEALNIFKDMYPGGLCNGWYLARPGKDYAGLEALAPA